jgi:pimeloyl-ACP methyl ester carboxylesterase
MATQQAIVIIGGYGSLWPLYLNMARHLEDLSGLQAVGVPLMPWHWWQANHLQDASEILRQLGQTVAWARRRFQAERFILVGHSAGGLIARLYLHDQPVWGETYAGVEHVTALISLGSPHCSQRGADAGWFLADEANRLVPGAFYGKQVHYRTVAGRFVQGRRLGHRTERHAYRRYHFFAGQGDLWGDGTVPLGCMTLDGAETVTLDGVGHSLRTSRDWYGGSVDIIRRWWPQRMQDAG